MVEIEFKRQTPVEEQLQEIVEDHEEDYVAASLKAGHLPDDVVETLKKSLS
jgi:hypothetical protein